MRFESLEEDFNRILQGAKVIGADDWITVPHTNPTPGKKHYHEYYDDESRALVEKSFANELTHFDYKFEP
ncbi:hypothetical protein N9181_01365 [bacterium]|nr:hypothetical protein [bacterium]